MGSRTARVLDKGLRGLAALLLAVVVALVAASALGRYLFDRPARFIEELSGLLMVALLFVALAVPGREGHIRVGIVSDRFRGLARHAVRAVALLILLAFVGVFAWDAVEQAWFNYRRTIRTELGNIPIWPWTALMPVALAILALRSVLAWRADGADPPPAARDGT